MKKVILALFLGCCATGVNCFGATAPNNNDVKEVATSNTDFAFALYGKLKDKDPKGNLFFSPYSISTVLAIVYAGARGETEKQMAKAMCFRLPKQDLYPALGTLQKQLVQEDKSSGYQLLLANALWLQKGEPVLKDFLDLNKNYYDTGISQLDFVNETEKSRQTINKWVENKTEDKIEDLIQPKGVTPETSLVLTNAIYFKGEWQNKFSWWRTRRADFNISDKDKVEVRMMHIEEYFKYYMDKKMQVLEMPYKGEELSMLVLLPNNVGLKEIEDTLIVDTLNMLLTKMWDTKVDVYFPKFKITWGTFVLNNTLAALGMTDAFNPEKADFSGINGKTDLWISDVFHKASIEVNEEGTEAAGGSGMGVTRGKLLVFRANRPFIFIIRDNRSGSILFMGRVMNPAE
jgi:serpin B